MTNVCFTDFKEAVKGLLPEKDADALMEEARKFSEARWRRRLEPKASALKTTFEDLLNQRARQIKISRRNSLMNVEKYNNLLDQIKPFKRKGKGLFAAVGGIESDTVKSRVSLVNVIKATQMEILQAFLSDLEENEVEHIFNSKKYNDALTQELEEPGSSGDIKIKKTAEIIRKHDERLRKKLNEEGADIAKAEDRIAKTSHNIERMKSATGNGLSDAKLRAKLLVKHKGDYVKVNEEYNNITREKWKNTVRPLLNNDKTFERVLPEEEEKFLDSVFNALITGVHKVPYDDSGNALVLRASSDMAKKLSKGRVLFFRKGGWAEYNRAYGYDNLHDAVLNNYTQSAKHLGIMKTFGTNPKALFEILVRKTKEIGETRQERGLKKEIKRAERVFNYVIGDDSAPFDGFSGKLINVFRNIQYASKTGGILLSSEPDLGLMVSALKQHGLAPTNVYHEALVNMVKGLPKNELRRIGRMLGIYSEGTLGSLFEKFGQEGVGIGMFSKVLKIQDKYGIINRWDNVNRWTMGSMLSWNLADQLGKTFRELIPSERRTLEISGINEKFWDLLNKHKKNVDVVANRRFLTPEIVNNFTKEDIRSYLGKERISDVSFAKTKENLKEYMKIYFTDQTAYGKVLPNESDMALMNAGAKTNTVPGVIWKMLTMFKSFHVASTRRTFMRFAYGNGAESLYDAFIRGKADFKGMGSYMLHSIPLGYLSYASKFLAAGLAPPDLSDWKTWAESANRGGAFFLYGSFMSDAFNTRHDFLNNMAGPAITTIAQTVDLLKGLATHGFDKDKPGRSHTTKRAMQLALNNMPLINLFYVKQVLNHTLLNGIYNKLDPTYLHRIEQHARKDNKHYLWAPTKSLGV